MTDDEYDDEAYAAWAVDPAAAFKKYGFPCWCGRFGGCVECDEI